MASIATNTEKCTNRRNCINLNKRILNQMEKMQKKISDNNLKNLITFNLAMLSQITSLLKAVEKLEKEALKPSSAKGSTQSNKFGSLQYT